MELTDILRQIDSLKKEAENLQPVKPELEKVFWDKFRLEFNYNSNHMEGNTLTYGHTQLLLIFGKVTGDYSFRELEEMKAHDAALKKIKQDAANNDFVFTEKYIKNINELILVEPYYRIIKNGARKLIKPGDYKELPNHVQQKNGEIFYFSQPEETRAHMGDLMEWYRTEVEKKELHPVQLSALFHYRFVRIHPFDDGNGRTARLIMNYILLTNGFAPLVIESADKKKYLDVLNKADTGDIDAFVGYVIELELKWLELYTKALKGEVIEEPNDFKKDIELLKRKLKTADDRIESTFSLATFDKALKLSIFPLVQKAYDSLSVFDDLFLSKYLSISKPAGNYEWPIIDFQSEKESIISAIGNIPLNENPITLRFRYVHNQFRKNDLLQFSYQTAFDFLFHTYYYEIISAENGEAIIKKYYHQNITEEESSEIVTLFTKKELNQIKDSLGF